jgi:hypothetical protein
MKKIFFIIFTGLLFLPLATIGQGPEPIITHPDQVVGLLSSILGYMWTLMGIGVIIMLLYAGFSFVTAAGDNDKINNAKRMIQYSLIGIVVMIMSGGVMLLIENFLRGA